ncbi:MAG TPA: glycosyltransferase, partial [Saprospiraceae bacterium]|nr:glycosyltransferase [Saprospiraceae bacterium]
MDIQQLYVERFNPDEEYLGTIKEVNQIEPLVSVCTTTYQHADYIEDCIEGILMQKTDFPIEIIVGEDESTDGTRRICKKYASEHPDKIR